MLHIQKYFDIIHDIQRNLLIIKSVKGDNMNENLKKLEKWYDSISGFEKLKFPEVKNLLNVMNAVTDVDVKKEIREKIITGTLHVI